MGASVPATSISNPKGLGTAKTINCLGDSRGVIGSSYFPPSTSLASVLAWAPDTTYAVGNLRTNFGLLYRVTAQTGPSASSGGPSGQAQSGIVDNDVTWAYVPFISIRNQNTFLHWVDALSLGSVRWNMYQGYSGITSAIVKAFIEAPGINFQVGDRFTYPSGGGVITVSSVNGSGGITGVAITDPGYGSTTGFGSPTIMTTSGTGATLSLVSQVGGTFAVPGCLTSDMVARLPDCYASGVDMMCVYGATNDISANVPEATIIANLKTCYEGLLDNNIRVIVIVENPRDTSSNLTTLQQQVLQRVARWQRDYVRAKTYANPNNTRIVICDPTAYVTDNSQTINYPIGGFSASNGAMLLDGLHPGPRYCFYMALEILRAISIWTGQLPGRASRSATRADGYDPILNPGGNYFEAQPYTASEVISAIGVKRTNGGNIYIAQVPGQCGASSAPTGTGSGITDGAVTWNYLKKAGSSVFGSGTKSIASASGFTTSGLCDNGWTLFELNESSGAAGTVIGTLELPCSDNQTGQRQKLSFNCTAGDNKQQFVFFCSNAAWASNNYGNLGILQSDLGSTWFEFDVELDLDAITNCTGVFLLADDNAAAYAYRNASGMSAFAGSASSLTLAGTVGEMEPWPNRGKIFLRTEPFQLPASPSSISFMRFALGFAFDSTNAPATLEAALNFAELRQVNLS